MVYACGMHGRIAPFLRELAVALSVAGPGAPALCRYPLLTGPILNPVWAFLTVGERPGTLSLLGGAIVFFTVRSRAVCAPGFGDPFTNQPDGDGLCM